MGDTGPTGPTGPGAVFNLTNLTAAKINITGDGLVSAANITTAKLGVTGDLTCTNLTVSSPVNAVALYVAESALVGAYLGVTGNLGVSGNVDIGGVLGVSGYTDSIVTYVPTQVADNYIKQNFASTVFQNSNAPLPDNAIGQQYIYPLSAAVFGNAFTGEEQSQFAGVAKYYAGYSPDGATNGFGNTANWNTDPDQYYRLASMGKIVGGLVAAKALEENIVNIDDPLYKYLGETGTPGAPGGNGWWAKENCYVMQWVPYGTTGPKADGTGEEVSAGEHSLYDQSGTLVSVLTAGALGLTGTWGITGAKYDPTLRHCLQMAIGMPYDFFDYGSNWGTNLYFNPKINRMSYQRGYNVTGITGSYRHRGEPLVMDPEFYYGLTGWTDGFAWPDGSGETYTPDYVTTGVTGAYDLIYSTIRNSYWDYTEGKQSGPGITGTLMTNHPGTVSEYGQGMDIFCVALGRAIITANETARQQLLDLAGSTAGLLGNAAIAGGIVANTAVWTSGALSQTIMGILYNLQTSFDATGSTGFNTTFADLSISDVMHYISDRIFTPIGATSLFFGGGQMEKPVDCGGFGDESSTDAYGFGCTGFSETPYYINVAFPSFQIPTNLPEGRFDVEADVGTLFVDGGYIWGIQVAALKGITGAQIVPYSEIVRSHTSTLAKSRQYTYAILDIPYNSTLEYKGFIGAAMCGKFSDYVKLLKLVANKGVWEGNRLVGAAALEFIINPSVASDQNIQYFDQALFEGIYGETVEPLDPADITGFFTLEDASWSYGFLVGDSFNNSKSTQRNPTFPFSSSNQIQWTGSFGTLWVVDLKTGVYFAAGTQQFVNNNFGLSILYRIGVPPPTGPILAPTQASSYLNYISQYKPLSL